jgi:hypothetical protein
VVAELAEWPRGVFRRPSRRVLSERVEVVCNALWEGGGVARWDALQDLSEGPLGELTEGFHEGLPRLRRGSSRGLSRRGLRPLGAVVAASAEGLPEGSAEASGRGRRGACRWCPRGSLKCSSRVTAGTFQGLRRAPSGAPRGRLRTTSPGRVRGASRGASRNSLRRPSSPRLEVSAVVSSVSQAPHRRVASGPSWGPRQEVLLTRVSGAAGRRATLCDSRLRHAVRPVDRETSARRRSGGVPGRQSGPLSPRSSIGRPR